MNFKYYFYFGQKKRQKRYPCPHFTVRGFASACKKAPKKSNHHVFQREVTQISPLTVGVLHPTKTSSATEQRDMCVCEDQAEIEPTLSSQIYIENDFEKNI